MGKHTSNIAKASILVHLQYVHQAAASRRAGLPKQIATNLKIRAGALIIERNKQGLSPLTIEEQITRKLETEQRKRLQTRK